MEAWENEAGNGRTEERGRRSLGISNQSANRDEYYVSSTSHYI